MAFPARLNLVNIPPQTDRIEKAIIKPTVELEQLRAKSCAERKQLDDFLKTDPLPAGTWHYVPYEAIQDWLAEREKIVPPLESSIAERDMRIELLERRLQSLRSRKTALERIASDRLSRLKLRREERAILSNFRLRLDQPSVMEDFIMRQSCRIHRFLEEREIPLAGYDACDALPISPDLRRGVWGSPGADPWRLANLKTWAALHGQLSKEAGFSPSQPVDLDLIRLFRRSNIKNIVEVGPGLRGLVHLLGESGIAAAAGVNLYAFELPDRIPRERARRDSGVKYIFADAGQSSLIQKIRPDIVLAVGVLSFGGQAHVTPALSVLEKYQHRLKHCHALAALLSRSMSDNPRATLVFSSIHGQLLLEQGALTDFSTIYWQPASRGARKIEIDRVESESARQTAARYFGTQASRERWEAWNKQASDLVILKPRR